MFNKGNKDKSDDQVIMRMMTDGKVRDITVKELLLSQNLSLEAITSLLIKKGVFTPDELLDELEHLQSLHAGKAPQEEEKAQD